MPVYAGKRVRASWPSCSLIHYEFYYKGLFYLHCSKYTFKGALFIISVGMCKPLHVLYQ